MMNQAPTAKQNTGIDIKLIYFILSMWFISNFSYVAFKLSSYAIGTFISSVIIILINYKLIFNFRLRRSHFLAILVVSFYLFIFSLYTYLSSGETKPLFSLPALLVSFFAAILFAQHVKNISYQRLENSILIVIIIFILLGWLGLLFPIACCNYAFRSKAVFPFSEQSHYALALGSLAVAYSITAEKKFLKIFIGINITVLSIFFPNLTLLLFAILFFGVYVFRFGRTVFILGLLFIPIFVIWVILPQILKNEYFASRLIFQNTRNLTTLVFLQGWELAYINFVQTSGMGLGFQKLGLGGTQFGVYSNTMLMDVGKVFNIEDGGFLASKLIAEFGLIGILITVLYLIFLIRFIFFAHRACLIIKNSKSVESHALMKKRLMLLGLAFAFFIEFFFRGIGYFSPGLSLIVVALAVNSSITNRIINQDVRK
ncbi:MAG: hypothetical protein Q8L64_02285 [bacterium]|nr:hypothetical protein [bacterium]